MVKSIFILFFVILPNSHADETSKAKGKTSIEKYLIRENQELSSYFDRAAEGLDRFLSGRRNLTLKNHSRVVLENSTFSKEGEGIRNSSDINANVHLPNLEEHWSLKFSSYDENEDLRGTQDRYLRRNPRERNYGTSLAFASAFGKIRTRFQPRVEFSNTLKVSHLLRFESDHSVGPVEISPKLEFFARPQKGTGVYAGLNFDFPLSDKLIFTLINGHEYQAFGNLFTTSNGGSLSQSLNDKMSLAYGLLFYGSSRPSYHLDNFVYSTTWSHIVYKNIVHYQIVPNLDFAKTHGFKGQAGIVFNIQLIF